MENGNINPLPDHLVEKAENELQEKKEWRERDIQALRDIISNVPGLNPRKDDEFLLRFLRAKKFDYDKAANQIQNYYSVRAKHKEIFENLKPSDLKNVFANMLQTILDDRDTEGRRVMILRIGQWNPSKVSATDLFKSILICLESVICEQETQICGVVALVDLEGYSILHSRHCTPNYARRMISIIQENIPIRFQGIHFLHEPMLFDVVYSFIRPFLREKIRDRVHFHGQDLVSLHAHIPPTILPQDYGGSLPAFDNSHFVSALNKKEPYFIESNQYGYLSENAVALHQEMDNMEKFVTSYYSTCAK